MRDLDVEALLLEPGSEDVHALLRLMAFPAAPDEQHLLFLCLGLSRSGQADRRTARIAIARIASPDSSSFVLPGPPISQAPGSRCSGSGRDCRGPGARSAACPHAPCREAGLVGRRPGQHDIVLDQDAVVEDRHPRRPEQLSVLVEARPVEDDVVGLPLAGLAAGVDERRVLAVERRPSTVGIGLVVVAVEDLDLVDVHQEDAAVAPVLAFALDHGRGRPLDMELAVAEPLLRPDRRPSWPRPPYIRSRPSIWRARPCRPPSGTGPCRRRGRPRPTAAAHGGPAGPGSTTGGSGRFMSWIAHLVMGSSWDLAAAPVSAHAQPPTRPISTARENDRDSIRYSLDLPYELQ